MKRKQVHKIGSAWSKGTNTRAGENREGCRSQFWGWKQHLYKKRSRRKGGENTFIYSRNKNTRTHTFHLSIRPLFFSKWYPTKKKRTEKLFGHWFEIWPNTAHKQKHKHSLPSTAHTKFARTYFLHTPPPPSPSPSYLAFGSFTHSIPLNLASNVKSQDTPHIISSSPAIRHKALKEIFDYRRRWAATNTLDFFPGSTKKKKKSWKKEVDLPRNRIYFFIRKTIFLSLSQHSNIFPPFYTKIRFSSSFPALGKIGVGGGGPFPFFFTYSPHFFLLFSRLLSLVSSTPSPILFFSEITSNR